MTRCRASSVAPTAAAITDAAKHTELGVVDQRGIVEREAGHEQRHGETDAGECARPQDVAQCTPSGSTPRPLRRAMRDASTVLQPFGDGQRLFRLEHGVAQLRPRRALADLQFDGAGGAAAPA